MGNTAKGRAEWVDMADGEVPFRRADSGAKNYRGTLGTGALRGQDRAVAETEPDEAGWGDAAAWKITNGRN
jgi:hypothetical protein